MQEELRRCNYIGNKLGIYFLGQTIFCNNTTKIESLRSICSFNSSIRIDLLAALALFEELKLIKVKYKVIEILHQGRIIGDHFVSFEQDLLTLCLRHMIDESLLMIESLEYDECENYIHISKGAFPLSAASLRNLLIEYSVILETPGAKFRVSKEFEANFTNIVANKRKKISIEQLITRLDNQWEQGKLAELFVLKSEKARLADHPMVCLVERISDIDVAAGYDIVSFNDSSSDKIDRYIEVKSYNGYPHFYWSENEIEIAKLKGNAYYIYLVDSVKINNNDYKPEIICNPHIAIFSKDDWLVEASSYLVKKI